MQRRADAWYERAGTDYGDTVVKRKWMRWRTYNRLIEEPAVIVRDTHAPALAYARHRVHRRGRWRCSRRA